MVKTRLLSGVILALLAVISITLGGPVLAILLCIISLIGFLEMTKALGVHKGKKIMGIEIVGLVAIFLYYISIFFVERPMCVIVCVTLTFLVMIGTYVVTFPKYEADTVIHTFFSFIYVAVMISFLLLTRKLEVGVYSAWMIFISSWGSDSFAYGTGMICKNTIGTHQSFPVLSPKKSVEGCIGGVVGSAISGAAFGFVFMRNTFLGLDAVWMMAILGAVGSIVSQMGDLAASAIKRNYGIKDYGDLIPGHGGIIDRFDSVIFNAPIIYFLTVLFMGY